MFEQIVSELVGSSPGVVGVIAVVVLFLKHLARTEDRMLAALDRNTETIGRCIEVIEDLEHEIESRKQHT